ncbi:MAG TPA: hypothetical protein VMS64_29685 [Candidatus Methylomirabilis sp.]|nr:hypothetical protein [Candidatus Methylomirabilis sp.]
MSYGALVLVVLAVTVMWARPFYNWDMLPYIGVAYEFGGASPREAHTLTYEAVRRAVDERVYRSLIEGSDYRAIIATDERAFAQQLPMYRVKVLYPWLIHWLERAGMNPARASVGISRVAYVALGLIVFTWLSLFLSPIGAFLVASITMSFSFVVQLAQFSTPDALSTWIVITALFLLFERGRVRSGAVLLGLSVLVRPDNLVWLVAAAVSAWYWRSSARAAVGWAAIAGMIVCVALIGWAGSPAWPTYFYHTFIQRLPFPAAHRSSLSLWDYLRVYLRQAHPANLPPFLLVFVLAGLGLALVQREQTSSLDSSRILLLTSLLFAGAHWVIYPNEERFLVPFYLVVTLVAVRSFTSEET